MSSDELSLFRLAVVADADPGALARILERFQNLGLLPRKVAAELSLTGVFHVEVDVFGIGADMLNVIAAKIAESPCIQSARWHRL